MSRQKCQVFIWKGGWYSRQARYIIRSASTPSSVILFPCIQSAVTTLCGGYHKGGVELVLPILFSHLPLQWLSLLVFWEFPSYAVYSLRGILSFTIPILSHLLDTLSSLFYHTEWIFFVPSKTERVAKGSIPSWSLWAQVRFKVDLPRIRSHSRQGVLMSSHLESSFLIAISSLTVLTISSVSIVIATLWVPLLRNKVFIIIVFTRGSWSEDPFLTHFNYYFTISSALCQVFYSFSLGIVSWGQLESLLLWREIRGFVRGFERRFEKVWAWMKRTTAHPV